MVNYGRQMEDGETAMVGISIEVLFRLNFIMQQTIFWPGLVVHSCSPVKGQEYRTLPLPSDHTEGRKQDLLVYTPVIPSL